jgi:hypothetical protein
MSTTSLLTLPVWAGAFWGFRTAGVRPVAALLVAHGLTQFGVALFAESVVDLHRHLISTRLAFDLLMVLGALSVFRWMKNQALQRLPASGTTAPAPDR